MRSLEGKVALISGTGGGMGRAAALQFALAGAKVVGCDVNAQNSAETVRLVREAGGIMVSLDPIDASNPDHAERWARFAEDEFGGIDILYNNGASLRAFGPFVESTLEQWNETLRYELTIVYVSTKAVWPYLVRRGGGVIISTASLVGRMELPPFRSAAHGACKAGVAALARMFAAEGRFDNIRSNSVSPGLIFTPVTQSYKAEDKIVGDVLTSKIPMGRMGEAEEVASVAVFLASDAASYINAQDIVIDGGMQGVNNTAQEIRVDYASSPLLRKARAETA